MDTNDLPEANPVPQQNPTDRLMMMEKKRAAGREQAQRMAEEAQRLGVMYPETGVGGMAGYEARPETQEALLTGYSENKRLPLRVRVENQLNRAVREGKRAQRLRELAELLAQHPDVARILDLVDELEKY